MSSIRIHVPWYSWRRTDRRTTRFHARPGVRYYVFGCRCGAKLCFTDRPPALGKFLADRRPVELIEKAEASQ